MRQKSIEISLRNITIFVFIHLFIHSYSSFFCQIGCGRPKRPRSSGIVVPGPTNYHRSNIAVVPAVHWPWIQQSRADIVHSKSRQDHSETSAEQLTRLVDRLDRDIVIYLRITNEICMQSAFFFQHGVMYPLFLCPTSIARQKVLYWFIHLP